MSNKTKAFYFSPVLMRIQLIGMGINSNSVNPSLLFVRGYNLLSYGHALLLNWKNKELNMAMLGGNVLG